MADRRRVRWIVFDVGETLIDGPASDVAYVGDRIDFDVVPADRAGMCGVLIRRGPRGAIGAAIQSFEGGPLVVDSIPGLLDVLAPIGPPSAGAECG